MNKKVYHFLACALFLFACTTTQAQTATSEDIEVVRSLHDNELRKMEKEGSPVLYVGKLLNWDWLKKKLGEGNVFGQGRDTINLSEAEKRSLMEQISQNENFAWNEHLFNNATRLMVDNEAGFEAMLKEEQQNAPANKHGYVYIFSRPLYLRGGNVALVGFGKMCGTDCNRNEEVAFYRKKGNAWEKWATICKRKSENGSCVKQNIAQK